MNKEASSPATFSYIQVLRGIAACMVVLFHTNAIGTHYARPETLFSLLLGGFGQVGVDVFFIISGFIIAISTSKFQSRSRFLLRRLIRIVPLYWVCTGVFLSIYLIKPQLFSTFRWDTLHVISSFLFFPAIGPAGKVSPVIGYGWSLNYEMFFYLLYGVMLFFGPLRRLLYISLAFFFIVIINLLVPENLTYLKMISVFYSDPIFLEFLFGVLLGVCFLQRPNFLNIVLVGAIATSALLLIILRDQSLFEQRCVHFGLPAVIIFCSFLLMDINLKPAKFGIYLGDISYSIYLIQTFSLTLYWKFLVMTGLMGWLNSSVVALTSVIATIVLAMFTYRFIEMPSSKILKKILRV